MKTLVPKFSNNWIFCAVLSHHVSPYSTFTICTVYYGKFLLYQFTSFTALRYWGLLLILVYLPFVHRLIDNVNDNDNRIQ